MYRFLFTILAVLLFFIHAGAQPEDTVVHKSTQVYAVKGADTLRMDIYKKHPADAFKKPCILFVFGGGFFMGRRDDTLFNRYFNRLAAAGFTVVSIDYRLGLLHEKQPSIFNTLPLKNAVDTAVSDLYTATNVILARADSLQIDPGQIILSGSSSGAITVLEAEWHARNRVPMAQVLPADFTYRGVIAFAGGLVSYTGKPAYRNPPAPTMLFHGTADNIVPYNKIKLFNRGLFGSKWIAKLYRKEKYPYYFQFETAMGHEVAGTPMLYNMDEILWFIETYIYQKKQYLIERSFNNLQRKRTFFAPVPEEGYLK